ncbi:MAG TPA: glycosyltransferase [Lacunisphaera sp.]
MKALLVSEAGMDPVLGFVEPFVHFLADQGIEVHYAYGGQGNDRLQSLVDFVHSRGGKTLNLAIGNRPALLDFRALRDLRAFVGYVRPDVIHSHGAKAGVLARALPPLGVHTPQIYQPHDYPGMRERPSLHRVCSDVIERLLGRWSTTVNISADEHAYAVRRLRLPAIRTVSFTHGIDTGHFHPVSATEKGHLRSRLGLPTQGRILGTLSASVPQKDPLTIYKAFAAALAHEPDLFLLHVGCGELDAQLDRFIARSWLVGRIIRVPTLPNPVDFHRAIDGFILASGDEGLSPAVMEAMSCNLPLFLSDSPGHQELQKLPLTHLRVARTGDFLSFARAILAWCTETPALCNHRACAVQYFDSRDTYANILSLYRRLQPVTWIDATPAPAFTSSSSGPRQALG